MNPTVKIPDDAATRLQNKLVHLDYLHLPISDYNKKYLGEHIRKLDYSLRVYAFILSHAIEKSGKQAEELCIADNGGGTGLLSLLAREAGFRKVIYNDYYDVSCHDAKVIASSIGLDADAYVHGEIDAVHRYCKEKAIHCNIIASRNTIEHIYDLDGFFEACGGFPSPVILFFATTANIKNPLVNFYTRRLQRKAELYGKDMEWGFKEMDSVKPFLKMREEMIENRIKEQLPDKRPGNIRSIIHPGAEMVHKLAVLTRGLRKDDIIKAADNYFHSGILPIPPRHAGNTCDPLTGNWEEHLVTAGEYAELAGKNGFSIDVISGFYSTTYRWKPLNIITSVLNYCIRTLPGTIGIYAAPFIGLCCKK